MAVVHTASIIGQRPVVSWWREGSFNKTKPTTLFAMGRYIYRALGHRNTGR